MDIGLNGPRPADQEGRPSTGRAPAIDIGRRVRTLRRERKWTLHQASDQTGMSLSALSKIERGELSPTLSSLEKLAAGFGVDVVGLLGSEAGPRAPGRRSINRRSDGVLHQTATCRNFWLAADLRRKRMLPIRTLVTAREPEEYTEWQVHPGEIFVYVLRGTLVVHSELYEPERLEEGDSIYYDAAAGTKWTCLGPETAEVLWVYA